MKFIKKGALKGKYVVDPATGQKRWASNSQVK
jgi:hypothetical protein